MCGIAGIIDFDLRIADKPALLQKMLAEIAHRGPDASMQWLSNDGATALGHQRLSILDLDARSNQPFHFEQLSIVFNGEVYNYVEIREELKLAGYQFNTTSDTEVIIKAYHRWGKDCVNQFIGMWAFVIYNSLTKEVFISRDRFGIKPFYYFMYQGAMFFASEVKSLKVLPFFDSALNLPQLERFLKLGWIHFYHQTLYANIFALPAAHQATFSPNTAFKPYNYYQPPTEKRADTTNAIEQFRSLFLDSVKIHMRSDVEVGTCLSGGIDSSSLVGAINVLFPDVPLKTFNIHYPTKGFTELHFAQMVNEKFKAIQPFYFSPTEDDVANEHEKFLYHQDFPAGGSSPISSYFVMQLAAKNGVKVLLDGQGADEYIIGYPHSFYRIYADLIRSASPVQMLNHLLAQRQLQQLSWQRTAKILGLSVASVFRDERAMLRLELNQKWPNVLLQSPNQDAEFQLIKSFSSNRTDDFLYHLTYTSILPSLLHYEDRNSMAFSIESRVPFLNHQLVDFMYSLPNEFKAYKGVTKYTLRNAMKPELPAPIYHRYDKMGFVTPGEVQWLNGKLSFLIHELETSTHSALNKQSVLRLIKRYRNGEVGVARYLWRIAQFNHWAASA